MMRIGLAVHGTTFSMGLHTASGRPPIRPLPLMKQAQAAGLEGVEIPLSLLENENIDALAAYASEQGLFIVLEAEGCDPETLIDAIRIAQQIGARTIRTFAGGARLGGDRRPFAGCWRAFLQTVRQGLQEALPFAEQAGIALTLENHQDLASEELFWLCETLKSPCFGITLDTGSTLATVEDPLDCARRLAPYIRHVHLKDYEVYLSGEGYYLARCPIGQGVVDFQELFRLFSQLQPDLTVSIELGALEARHVRAFADDFWPEYPQRSAAQIARALRFILTHAHLSGDLYTPYEKGEPAEIIIGYEQQQFAMSLEYLKTLNIKGK